MAIDWNMARSPDIIGTAMNALNEGRTQRATTAYAQNPNDQNLNALAPYKPEFVIQQKQAQAAAMKQDQERQLIGAALNGDPNARQQLAYVNSDVYLKLGEHQKKAMDSMMGSIAQQAFHILQLPKDQQEPALQQALQGLQAQGVDTSGFKLSGNPEVDLRTALAVTGHLDEWEKFAQPNYTPVGEGGLAGFQFGQPIQQGGQPQNFGPAAPPGVTFTPISGGPTPPASGNFRP